MIMSGFLKRVVLVGCSLLMLNACDETSSSNTSSSTSQEPPPEPPELVLANQFASNLQAEIWAGSSLEYINGRVHGYDLYKLDSLLLPARDSRTYDLKTQQNLLIVIGLIEETEMFYLADAAFSLVSNGDVITINPQAEITHTARSVISEVNNDGTVNQSLSDQEQFAMVDFIADASQEVHKSGARLAQLMAQIPFGSYISEIMDSSEANVTINTALPTGWVLNNGLYSTGLIGSNDGVRKVETQIDSSFNWPDQHALISQTGVIQPDITDPASYFDQLSSTFDGENLSLDFTAAGPLAVMVSAQENPTSPFRLVGQEAIVHWGNELKSILSSVDWQKSLQLELEKNGDALALYLYDSSPMNYSFKTDYNFLRQQFQVRSEALPIRIGLSSSIASEASRSNGETLELRRWDLIIDIANERIQQEIDFRVLSAGTLKYSGNMEVLGGTALESSPVSISYFLTDPDGKPIILVDD